MRERDRSMPTSPWITVVGRFRTLLRVAAVMGFVLGLAAGGVGLGYFRVTNAAAAGLPDAAAAGTDGKKEAAPRQAVLPPIKPAWKTLTLPEEANPRDAVDRILQLGKDQPDDPPVPFLPPFVPLLSDGKVIYRSFQGVRVDNLRKKGEPEWWSWLDASIHTLRNDPLRWLIVDQWRKVYPGRGRHHLLLENTLLGSASNDGAFVYVVDDLAVLPHPDLFQGKGKKLFPMHLRALQESMEHNTLKAYALESGKLTWELGGKFDPSQLKDSFFLGPPLPLAGKLFVLTEKKDEISLVCLQPRPPALVKLASGAIKEFPQPPQFVWLQKLLSVPTGLNLDMQRRAQVSFVSYSDGVLFCVTNAGAAVGVDLLSHQPMWTFTYRQEKEEAPIGKSWKASPPALRAGKVVFTAPDGHSLHCLGLRDGKSLWKADRGEGMYLAGVFGNRVLVVGQSKCRILALADGKEVANFATGVPAGQGVANGSRYYLPLRTGAESKAPEICVVDVAKGAVAVRFPLANRQVPGNLVMGDGEIVSQTMTGIAGFPQLRIPPEQLGRPLAADELGAAWTNLGDAAVRPSVNAGWLLAAVPEQAVPFLKQRVRAIPIPDAKRLDRLIRELDNNRFEARARATEELAELEDAAEAVLKKALAAKPPLEVKRRIEELLRRLAHRTPSPDQLRALRAVEVLRTIGTPAALDLLKELAGGAPSAQLTRKAQAVLK